MKIAVRSMMVKFVLIILLAFEIRYSSQQITHVPICASPAGYDIVNLTKLIYE